MSCESEAINGKKQGPPPIKSVLDRRLAISIINYALLAFVDQTLSVLVPLVYSSKPSLGGLNFSSFTIGIVLGVWGVVNGLFNICFVPSLIRRFGIKRLFIVATISMLVSMLMFIGINTVGQQAPNDDAIVGGKAWAVIVVQLLCWVPVFMGYSKLPSIYLYQRAYFFNHSFPYLACIFVFINEGVDDYSRGTVNGLAQMSVSTVRAIAPISASSLSAATMQSNLAGGNMAYIVLTVVPLVSIFMAFQLHNK
jgi:hypothetical protein